MYAGTLETTKVTIAARVASDISDVFCLERTDSNGKLKFVECRKSVLQTVIHLVKKECFLVVYYYK